MRAVGAQDGEILRNNRRVRDLKFWDAKGDKICEYNPSDSKLGQSKHRVEENEELIGVYGVKGMDNEFTCFGFLVKVRQL